MKRTKYILFIFFIISFCSLSQKTAEEFVQDGLAKVAENNHKAAISDFTKALKINPSLSEAYISRAYSKRIIGKLLSAITDYNKALKINPNDPESYNSRGEVFLLLGHYTESISDFQ